MLTDKAKTTWAKIVADAEIVGEQPHRALALPRLRPYLGDKRTIRQLRAGFAVLIRGLLRLLRKGLRAAFKGQAKPPPAEAGKPATGEETTPGKGKKEAPKATPVMDWLEQAAIGLLAVVVAAAVAVGGATAIGSRLLPYLPIITGITIPGLLIAAWMVAPPTAPKAATINPPGASEEPCLDTPEGRRLAFLRWLEKTTRGASGIHLGQMHHQLTQQEATAGFPRHHLRPLLDHYQIPVKRTLRVGDVAGRSGVAREAIVLLLQQAEQAPPLPVESEGVERVGESV